MPNLPRLLVAGLAAALAACSQTSAPEPAAAAASGVTPAGFSMPGQSGCAGEIARYRAIMDNDLSTGHVNKTVYDKVSADLERASAAYSSGRDGEAVRIVAATRSRYGY